MSKGSFIYWVSNSHLDNLFVKTSQNWGEQLESILLVNLQDCIVTILFLVKIFDPQFQTLLYEILVR